MTDEEAAELSQKVEHMDKCLRIFLAHPFIRNSSTFWPLMVEMGITPPMRQEADGKWVSTAEDQP